MKNAYIAIVGVMGSGKTTVGQTLAKHFDFEFLEENVTDNQFLERFYKDPNRWTFHSEVYFLVEKIRQTIRIKKTLKNTGVVQDTPILQDVYSYAKTQRMLGNFAPDEWKLYQKIYTSVSDILPMPDVIVYLDVSIEEAMRRIAMRNRPYEKDIKKKDLQDLATFNNKWMKKFANQFKMVKINVGKFDLVHRKKDRVAFVKMVEGKIKS